MPGAFGGFAEVVAVESLAISWHQRTIINWPSLQGPLEHAIPQAARGHHLHPRGSMCVSPGQHHVL